MKVALLIRLAVVAAATAAASGCSGAQSYVRADSSRYPISLSERLRGPDGALIRDSEKRNVGTFELHYSAWSALWTLIPLSNRTRDISSAVNDQVGKAGGDAIVGLDVGTGQCGWNYWTILGILPGCNNVVIRGHIVKLSVSARPSGPSPAVPAPAPLPPTPVSLRSATPPSLGAAIPN
jgi:hypothetical protein